MPDNLAVADIFTDELEARGAEVQSFLTIETTVALRAGTRRDTGFAGDSWTPSRDQPYIGPERGGDESHAAVARRRQEEGKQEVSSLPWGIITYVVNNAAYINILDDLDNFIEPALARARGAAQRFGDELLQSFASTDRRTI